MKIPRLCLSSQEKHTDRKAPAVDPRLSTLFSSNLTLIWTGTINFLQDKASPLF